MSELTVLEHRKVEMRPNVERGARLLDEKHPEWYTWIDPGRLAMADGCSCIIGQTYNHLFLNEMLDLDEIPEVANDVRYWHGEGEDDVYRVGMMILFRENFPLQHSDSHGFTQGDIDNAVEMELYDQLGPSWGNPYVEAEKTMRWEALEQVWIEAIKERYERFGGDPVSL